jgi:hypothetical protein
MVTTMLGNDTINMGAISRNKEADVVGGEIKKALEAVLLLGKQGEAALALKEGIGGPGGAPEDAGGISAGGHGVEILVELSDGDLLGLIHGQEKISGGTNDLSTRFAGEKLEAGLIKLVDIALGGFPKMTGTDTGIQGAADTLHVVDGLGLEGGRDGDDATADAGVAEKEPGEEMGLELVLAGLAG